MKKAWPIGAACVSFVALLAIARPATAQGELRIARVSRPAGANAEVILSVPHALSGRDLAPSAVTVTVDGTPVNATATREYGRGFDLTLVIETSNTATEQSFLATKGAAVEFILQQPADTRVELVTSDPPRIAVGYTTDRAALIAAIKSLTRAQGHDLVTALTLAAGAAADTSRPIAIIAAATGADATVPERALRAEGATPLRTGLSQLYAVGAVSSALAQLAAESGGFAQNADVRQLVGAFDSVASDLAGRYRLTFPVPANAERIDVRVAAPDGTASASIALPSGASKSAGTAGTTPATPTTSRGVDGDNGGIGVARSSSDPDDSPSRALPIALVMGLLAVGLLCVVLIRRSRRRPQQSPSHAEPVAAAAPPAAAPAAPAAPALAPAPPPLPTIDLRRPVPNLVGYALTALCDDGEVAELRAALEPCGIVVSQAHTVDEALRAVVTGSARALYVDGAASHASELAAAVRQRNNAGWSSCPTLVHDSRPGPPDPALVALADAFIAVPIDASRVVAALATRGSTTTESSF